MTTAKSKETHSTYDKVFSSLFSVQGDRSNEKYQVALNKLGLGVLVDFRSIEENCSEVLQAEGGGLKRGPESSFVVDVPGKGDCWLIALLTPILGFKIAANDERGIIKHIRLRLSEIVVENATSFEDVFEGRQEELLQWSKKVKSPGTWGGDTEMEIFSRITGLVIHVLNCEHPNLEGLRHFLPRRLHDESAEDSWSASVVVEYGFRHYKAVIPSRFLVIILFMY